jgi:hypothetical protein
VGATLHLAQGLSVLIVIAAMAHMVQTGYILLPRGGTALLLWMGVQAILLSQSGALVVGLQFFVLLLLVVATFFGVVQLYGQSDRIESLMRVYMGSYVFVGLFGLLQFVLPLLGFPTPLVKQWIVHGKLARINGFNYEPSFYATYLMMGWIMMVELRYSKAAIAQGRLWKWATICLTLSLLFSSSKTGWLVMCVELVARLAPAAWRMARSFLRQVRRGQMLVPLPRGSMVLVSVVVFVLAFAGARALTSLIDPLTLLQGTGIGGTAAHSYNDRSKRAEETLSILKESPWIGSSLGGVPVAVAVREGATVRSMADARLYWGFPVLLDVLVASGVFGFIPFLYFLYVYTFGAVRLSVRYWPEERAKWLRAMARAMIMEWIMLMSDQNLLRTYLWFHFAMMAAVAYHLEFSSLPQREIVPQQSLISPTGAIAASL